MRRYIIPLLISLTGCTLPVEEPMRHRQLHGYPPNSLDYDHVADAAGTFNPDGYGVPPGNPNASIQDIINAIKHDGHVLDPNNVQAIGNAVQLNKPSRCTGTGLPLNPGEGANQDVAATAVVQAVAVEQDSPQSLLVTINPPAGFVNDIAFSIDIKARIYWGTGGTFAVADVDCINGTQVSVQGNFVRVDGLYLGVTPALVSQIPNVTLGATIGYGTRAGSSTPPTWTRIDRTAIAAFGGPDRIFNIPSFAKDVTVYTDGGGLNSVPITTGFSSNGTGAFVQVTQGADETPLRIIPGAMRFLILHNPNAFAIQANAAVFGIAL